MSFFGVGKNKKLKEYENKLDILHKVYQLFSAPAALGTLGETTHEQRVIGAIFFDVMVVYLFNEFGKEGEDAALSSILHEDNLLNIEPSDINIGRYLAQGVKDESAIFVAKKSHEALENTFNGNADAYALNSLFRDEKINFSTEDFGTAILVADNSPQAFSRPKS